MRTHITFKGLGTESDQKIHIYKNLKSEVNLQLSNIFRARISKGACFHIAQNIYKIILCGININL